MEKNFTLPPFATLGEFKKVIADLPSDYDDFIITCCGTGKYFVSVLVNEAVITFDKENVAEIWNKAK